MKKAKKIFSILFILIGVCLLLYPLISNYVNGLEHTYTYNTYEKVVEDKADYSNEFKQCYKYNETLRNNYGRFEETDEKLEEYNNLLNISQGLMAYVIIPKINVNLPIYHYTDKKTLSEGVGHIYGTSLPVGGVGTNSVIAGHTGLSTAIMFNDLTEMETGDKFYIKVYDQTLTYEVDKVELVEPRDVSVLQIDKTKDYVTLLTCYPIGLGTQRLIVRGHKIEATSEQAKEWIETTQHVVTMTDKINWGFIAVGAILIIYFIISMVLISKKISKKVEKSEN